MGYASFSNSGVVVGNPDRIWEAFAHPEIAAMYAEHQVRVVPSPGFELAVGNSWAEHHGEECGFDVVVWRITRYEPHSVIEFRGRQTGVLQRVRLAMEPGETGHRLTEEIRFSPAIAGKAGPSVIAWLLLATGLLARLGNDQGQTFGLLREHLGQDPQGGTSEVPLEDRMRTLAADFVAEWEDFHPAAGKLDGTQGSLTAVDAILQGFFEDRKPLEKDMRLMTAAYVLEVARAAFGGRYVPGAEPDEVVLVVGEPECAIEVRALEKVAQRALNGPADSLAFFHAGIAPLLERGVSAILG